MTLMFIFVRILNVRTTESGGLETLQPVHVMARIILTCSGARPVKLDSLRIGTQFSCTPIIAGRLSSESSCLLLKVTVSGGQQESIL